MTARVMFIYNTMKYLHRMRVDLIKEMQQRGIEVVAVAPFDTSEKSLIALGVTCVDWPLVGHSVNPLRELRSFVQLWRIVRRHRPTHVFSFTIKPVIYGSLIARWCGRLHAFSMITGLGVLFAGNTPVQRLLQRAAGWLYRVSLHANRAVFVQNDEHARYLRESGFIDPGRVVQIPGSGVNLESYRPSADRNRDHEMDNIDEETRGTVFLMASRMLRHKGVEEYIRACSQLSTDRHTDSGDVATSRFMLAGGLVTGPSAISREQLEQWLSTSPVEYLGEVEDMQTLLRGSDALVLPSYYPEGTPRVLLEALACGLVIVTTDTPGCRDTVVNGSNTQASRTVNQGDNGFLVSAAGAADPDKEGNEAMTAGLAACMKQLVDDPLMRRSMGRASRDLATTRYDVRTVNAVVLDKMAL